MDTKSFGGRIAALIRRKVFPESHAEVVHNSEQVLEANSKGSAAPLSAVSAGCARSAAPHLSGVLANIERLSKCYSRVAFVFVENDSADATKKKLKRWIRGRSNGHLIELDGLAAFSGRYRGLTENGLEICEHVAFDRDVSRRGQLYIYPALRNTAPSEHLGLNPSP